MSQPLRDALASIRTDRVIEFARAVTAAREPDGREGERAEVVADLLANPRIDIHVDPVLPGRPNVIARVRGTGGAPGVLLNAHLDAGYVQNGWSHDPHEPWQVGTELYGGAISDMLGGLASMMATIEAAASVDPLPGDVVLLANMYHDSNGLGTKYALASDGDWPQYGINGEPTASGVLTTHGGCVKFQIDFSGRIAHVSRSEEGIDALSAAVDVYQAMRSFTFTHTPDPTLSAHPRFTLGLLQAGYAPAAVPDSAVLKGDLRTVPGMSWQTVRADLEGLVAEAVPASSGVGTKVSCIVRQRPFVGPTGGVLFDALRAGHRDVYGSDPAVNAERAAQSFVTDAVDMAQAGIETLIYGPGSWHFEPDEFIDVDEMARAAQVYLATAYRLMNVR
jgi:acetylornithine deacetylase/succinyl-diaminopimelate desuccinylase-like protein